MEVVKPRLSTPVKRRLTTILAANVESYTRLMRDNEEATLRTLSEYREVVDGLIERHDGRIFSTAAAFEQIKHKLSLGFEDMGAQQVKNIDEPISVYRLVPAPISVSQKPKKPAAQKRTRSEKKRRHFRIPAKKTLAFGIVVGAVFIWYDSSSLPSVKEACNQIQRVEFKIREYGSPTSLASRALQREQKESWGSIPEIMGEGTKTVLLLAHSLDSRYVRL